MPIAGPGGNASARVRGLVGERHRVIIASRRAHHDGVSAFGAAKADVRW